MRQLKLLMLTLLLVTLSSPIAYGKNGSKPRRLTVIGTVVAYDRLAGLFTLTSAPSSQLLIVRVEKRGGKSEKSSYIQIEYIVWPHERANKDINDFNRKWRFKLTRERECDGPLQELLFMKGQTLGGVEKIEPRLNWTNSEEEKKIPSNAILRCYTLQTEDIKAL